MASPPNTISHARNGEVCRGQREEDQVRVVACRAQVTEPALIRTPSKSRFESEVTSRLSENVCKSSL